jgi:CRP-like cAMP-binding protein
MFPESLRRVFADRVEYLAGQALPASNGIEPIVHVLVSGCVTLMNRIGMTSAVFWPGDLIVAPVERAGAPMVLKAVAETVCLRAASAGLLAECGQNLDGARWVWQQQERRELELHRRLELLSAESVERRVLLTVADLADRAKMARPGLPMPLAQNEVAELAGATRETTSTLLNRMRRLGMVELGRRRIHVVDSGVLRTLQGLTETEPATAELAAVAAGVN